MQTFDGIVQSYPIDKKLCKDGQIHEGEISVKLGLRGIPSISESVHLHVIFKYSNILKEKYTYLTYQLKKV